MEFCLLADDPSAASTVAQWYFEQWCKETGRATLEAVQQNVSAAINRDAAPVIVLVKNGDALVAAAELKIREMDAFPDYEFWLGGVYVTPSYRGKGIASDLVSKVIDLARNFGIKQLHLQTEDLSGGLYRQFGFEHLHQVDSKGIPVTVMRANTGV